MFEALSRSLSQLAPQSFLAMAHGASGSHDGLIVFLFALAGFIFVMFVLVALVVLSVWKVYQKAGRPGWASIIPFYNYTVMLEIVSYPVWWVFLMFVPVVNIVIGVLMLNRISRVFGKGRWFTVGLLFLPFIFWPLLAFGKVTYKNTYAEPKPITPATQWALYAAGVYLVMEISFLTLLSSMVGAPQPLQILSSNGYAVDGQYVYYQDEVLSPADPYAFKTTPSGEYGLDHEAVYYGKERLPGADPQTFEEISGYYAKDSTSVYSGSDVVKGADPATFEVLGYTDGSSYYTKDAAHVFYYGEIIPGADAATFTLSSDPSYKYHYDARDKNSYYLYGEAVDIKKQNK